MSPTSNNHSISDNHTIRRPLSPNRTAGHPIAPNRATSHPIGGSRSNRTIEHTIGDVDSNGHRNDHRIEELDDSDMELDESDTITVVQHYLQNHL